MKKSEVSPHPGYFARYVDLIDNIDLSAALEQSAAQLDQIDLARWLAIGSRTYAPGKWTLNDIIQHLIDSERVFTYRALRFARQDITPLAGFSQEDYARHTTAASSSVNRLLAEWKVLRQATLLLFAGFTDEMLLSTGICNETEMSVLGLGFTLIGHQQHHLHIIEERYLPLAG